MRLKLTRLVLITCTALLGIIALQVFWLVRAYRQQQEKLLSLADNTLLESQLLTGVNASMRAAARSLAGDVLREVSVIAGSATTTDTIVRPVSRHYKIDLGAEYQGMDDSALKKHVLDMMGLDSGSRKTYTVASYKEKVKEGLQAKGADLPFHLALIDADGRIVACTTDTASFLKPSLRTGSMYTLPVSLNPQQSGRIQLSFPSATFYLLKGMGLILVLSLLFITVCACSFSYMVALFYRQKRTAEIKNDFMNNMTHELKTPISSVSVALELLRDESVPVSPEVKAEYFNIAGKELDRLTRLVDKVLRMAAFEKMEVKVLRSHFDVAAWIEEVLQTVRPMAESGKARIDRNIQPPGLQVYADKGQMSSVLQNLLENALKYHDRAKPEIHIQVTAREDERAFSLEVRDNGSGIPAHYRDRIFEKFFRVPSGDNHETSGYGLGLSYAKEIVQLHGGSIQVESEMKKGTTFTIILPKKS